VLNSELRVKVASRFPTSGALDDYQVKHDFPDIGRRTMLLNRRRLQDGDDKAELILLAIEDVIERGGRARC
jgi:hypothetical protein